MAIKVRDILKDKGLEVIAIDSSVTVDAAVKKMVERNIGAILVMEEGNFVGMFTERDALRCWSAHGPFDKVLVKDIMSKTIRVAEPGDDLEYVMSIMSHERIRHLPVIDHGHMVGVVSIRDVVKYHIGNLEAEVRYLKDYMFSS
ncbi:MAG: CBS domain-containing protein [Nitrospirota bacterium]